MPALLAEWACQCLLAPPIEPGFVPVTPHLVELRHDSPLPLQMQGIGRGGENGGNWGLLRAADAGFATLRMALRPNQQAITPHGRLVLFRFHDPRVFVPCLETCRGDDLDPWFGPVTDWWVPTGTGILHFRRGNGVLLRNELPRPAI